MKTDIQCILKFIEKIKTVYIIFFSLVILWIDLITGREVQFPLIYVLPVGIAAWRSQKTLAYTMCIIFPLVRGIYEFPWHTSASLPIACINILMEIAALMLYSYLLDKTSTQTRRLEKTVTAREQEIKQLRTFARNTGTTLQGRGLSPGMVEGVALIYLPTESEFISANQTIMQDDVETEIKRLDFALSDAILELANAQKQFAGNISTVESELLDVHMTMLKDASFWDKCRQRMRENQIRAEQAVAEEVQALVAAMEGLKQNFMRERSADIRDMGRRVLRYIRTNGNVSPNQLKSLPPNTIIVTKEFLPSDMLQCDRINLVALVTEFNGPESHVAIMARVRNIPLISDIKDVTSLLETSDHLLVDADIGTVTMAPTKMQLARFVARRSQYTSLKPTVAPGPTQSSSTKDGVPIRLYANIGRADEARLVLEYKLDGVGLFRSEFLFLDVEQPPDFDTQYTAYSTVAKMLNPHPVVIRTMDLGGDKIPRFNRTENEIAFRIGKRGLAFSLTEKAMFNTQLRAIIGAAQVGDVRIMFPMVMTATELREANHWVDEIMETGQLSKRPPIGAMIETPAAVFNIHEIVQVADFISIGTNDLAHFILAADRQSQESSGMLPFMNPSVLRAIDMVVRATMKQEIDLTVCGEAAGNPEGACLLVGMGIRNLSMNPFRAARIHGILQMLTIEQTETAARDTLSASTPEDVRQIVESVLRGTEA